MTLFKNPENIEEAKKFMLEFSNYESMRQASRMSGVAWTTFKRRKKRAEKLLGSDKPIAGGNLKPTQNNRIKLKGKRFLFTSAQNNTFIHDGFLKSIEHFCKDRGAELIIGKFRYNKSGFQNFTEEDDQDLWYDPKIADRLSNQSMVVCDGLIWCGELDILPTAVNPLSGLDTYTKSSSGIFPHAKVVMKSLATPKHEDAKFLFTTGTITKRNYIQRKAGQKAEFHHTFGALYVEIDDDGDWFARQINADDDGSFYDLTDYYTPHGAETGHNVEAITWGDIHAEKMDGEVNSACWYGQDSMIEILKPSHQFIHDLTDFEPRNHHNIKDPHFLAKQHYNGINNIESAMKLAADFLKDIDRPFCKTIVVESNHDLAFEKWLKNGSGANDPENAYYWHEANAVIHRSIRENKDVKIFEWAVRSFYDFPRAEFLDENDSYVICPDNGGGIECAIHGHRGANGSRGSPQGYRNIARRLNTAHTHSASIMDGVYTAGVSASMEMGYNIGLSSWSFSHIITYKNSKRCIVTVKNGKWRAQ